jgi:hypothetical protein
MIREARYLLRGPNTTANTASSSLVLLCVSLCSLSSQTLVDQDLDFRAPVFSSTLCRLVGRCRIRRTHRSRRYDMPHGHVAALDQVGHHRLGSVHAQLLIHGGAARGGGKTLHGNDVAPYRDTDLPVLSIACRPRPRKVAMRG